MTLDHFPRLVISVASGVVVYAVGMALLVPKQFWREVRSTAAAIRK